MDFEVSPRDQYFRNTLFEIISSLTRFQSNNSTNYTKPKILFVYTGSNNVESPEENSPLHPRLQFYSISLQKSALTRVLYPHVFFFLVFRLININFRNKFSFNEFIYYQDKICNFVVYFVVMYIIFNNIYWNIN